jgi:cysteine-rich repeat protein
MSPGVVCLSCAAGNSGETGSCRQCKQGLYKAEAGEDLCKPCTYQLHARPGEGATSCVQCSGTSECQCAAGYGLYGNLSLYRCQECTKGSYSLNYGLAECVPCAPGSFQNLDGQTQCLKCTEETTSVQGATLCSEQCEAGKYLTGTGCTACPSNSNSIGRSVGIEGCICDTGYVRSDEAQVTVATWCDACSAGYYRDKTASVCNKCIENTTSVIRSVECYTPCSVGFYLTTDGCKACIANGTLESTPLSDGMCVCARGFTGGDHGFECVPCPTGTYKDIEGSGECKSCPAGLNYSPLSAASLADCTCKAGTFLRDGVVAFSEPGLDLQYERLENIIIAIASSNTQAKCENCPAGTFKQSDGIGMPCTPCGVGEVSIHAGATTCSPCGANEGTVMTLTDCVPCTGPANCTGSVNCMPGTGVATSRTSCRNCSTHETFDVKTATCVCLSDQYRPFLSSTNSNECSFCPEDTFKPMQGDEQCTACELNSRRVDTTNLTLCVCKTGAFRDVWGGCTLCVIGTYKDNDGGHACTKCNTEHSTDNVGSVVATDCKCAAGSFNTDVDMCEKCPVQTYNPFVGDGDISQCRMCPYKRFQPILGQKDCLPMFVSLPDAFEATSRVVGLFVEGSTSCAYVSRESTMTTDKICWGEQTAKNPPFTGNVMGVVTHVCGDGMLHPIMEQCDDGNYESGDGCSKKCEVEHDFFCEGRATTANVTENLQQESVCCRVSGNPPSHSPKCKRCVDREPPYAGVRFRARDCSLQDIDECLEGTDGCVLQDGGVVCVNLDRRNHPLGFKCECPTGEFLLGGICTAERFASRFVLDVDAGIKLDTDRLELYIRAEAQDATGVANLLEVRVDSTMVGLLQCTLFVDSWTIMQDLTAKFNVTHLLQLIESM